MEEKHNFINVILINLGFAEKNEFCVSDDRELFEAVNVAGDSFDVPGDDIESGDIFFGYVVWFVRSINV